MTDISHEVMQEILAEASKQFYVAAVWAMNKNGVIFPNLHLRAEANDSETWYVLYDGKTPILRWTQPQVLLTGNEMEFPEKHFKMVWKIQQINPIEAK